MEPLYIFLHTPKTGGTTFNGHCARELELHVEFVHLGPFGRKDAAKRGLPPFEERPVAARARARVIAGHETWYGVHELVPDRAPRYVTFVRDPAARFVSQYNFVMGKPENRDQQRSFEEWYAEQPRNLQTRLYNRFAGRGEIDDLDGAKELLGRMWFVGVTERLDRDLPALFAAIGLSTDYERMRVAGRSAGSDHPMERIVPKRLELDAALAARLAAENALDVELHRHAAALNGRGVPR